MRDIRLSRFELFLLLVELLLVRRKKVFNLSDLFPLVRSRIHPRRNLHHPVQKPSVHH